MAGKYSRGPLQQNASFSALSTAEQETPIQKSPSSYKNKAKLFPGNGKKVISKVPIQLQISYTRPKTFFFFSLGISLTDLVEQSLLILKVANPSVYSGFCLSA